MTSANRKAQELAEQYGLRTEDVAEWLRAYPRHEVERACKVSAEMDAEVSDILAMLDVGFDWRRIQKALRVVPDEDEDDESY